MYINSPVTQIKSIQSKMSATNSSTSPTLCIPRVFPNIKEQRIRRIFDDLNLGVIDRVDIVPKTSESGEQYNRVFVHFSKWNTTSSAEEVRTRLQEGKEIKIIYDEPWFWRVSAYRPPITRQRQERPKPSPIQRPERPERPERPKATIELDSTPAPSRTSWQMAKATSNNNRRQYEPTHFQRPPPPRRCISGSEEWLGNDLPNMKNYHSRPPSKEAHEAFLNEFLPERRYAKQGARPTNNKKPEEKDNKVTKAIKAEGRQDKTYETDETEETEENV